MTSPNYHGCHNNPDKEIHNVHPYLYKLETSKLDSRGFVSHLKSLTAQKSLFAASCSSVCEVCSIPIQHTRGRRYAHLTALLLIGQ